MSTGTVALLQSLFLALMAALQIVFALPLAFFIYRVVFNIEVSPCTLKALLSVLDSGALLML